MSFASELGCDGVLPSGPVSGWPKERHERLMQRARDEASGHSAIVPQPMPTVGKMAKGLFRTASQAVRHGKVSSEIREERYDMCKACPFFDAESKRCKDCGCFMEAKTWVGGDPNMLCPQKKWSR